MAHRQNLVLLGTLVAVLLLGAVLSGYMYFTGTNPFISSQQVSKTALRLAYDQVATEIKPYSSQPAQRVISANIFEGLTFTDSLMRPTRQLALSYGNISPKEWEIKLKEGVSFHDGSTLVAEDVVKAFDTAKKDGDTELRLTLDTIERVEAQDENTLRITTTISDPLLPMKLAAVPVVKANPNPNAPSPLMGTGPYMLTSKSEKRITFTRFEGYHGSKPQYKDIEVLAIADKFDRVQTLKEGKIDMLATVPTANEHISDLEQSTFLEVRTVPSLETMFLMFNVRSAPLSDPLFRKVLSAAINTREVSSFAEGFATPTNQFISSGVTGFDSDLPEKVYNPEEASTYVNKRKFEITISVLKPMKILAEYAKVHLGLVGVDVIIDEVPTDQEFIERLSKGDMEAYILGWKFDLGDSLSFFKTNIHSQRGNYGEYNGHGFGSAALDAKIESAENELDEAKRGTLIKEVQKTLLDAHVGVPLFESKRLYALKKMIKWEPRLDGILYFPDITTE